MKQFILTMAMIAALSGAAFSQTPLSQNMNDNEALRRMLYETNGSARAAVITPSDTVDLPAPTIHGIYVGVSGDIKVNMTTTGTAIVFKAVPVGILRIQAKRIYTTNTTATNLVALY
jgi:hypothetical protein